MASPVCFKSSIQKYLSYFCDVSSERHLVYEKKINFYVDGGGVCPFRRNAERLTPQRG